MLSQTTEYALRAVVYLASSNGEPRTSDSIAKVTQIPVSYLAKIMLGLVRAQLVQSQRGLHGGFLLIPDPDKMTIYDVVQAVDPIMRILKCPLEIEGHGDGLCLLHATLDHAMEQVEIVFRSTTISKLVGDEPAVHGHCPFPNNPPAGTAVRKAQRVASPPTP